MELLKPSPPPHPHPHHAPSPPSISRFSFHGVPSSSSSQAQPHLLPQAMAMALDECPEKVHVALGKTVDKAANLLQWAFTQFRNTEIVILHAYQPSPMIPTLCM